MKVLVIHGPNLNMLGTREPEHYGTTTLDGINRSVTELGSELGLEVSAMQSNSEAEIVETIQAGDFDFLIINPAAFTHTSVAIRDAISAVDKPAIEVHLSNVHAREEFRQRSYPAGACIGQISGFGVESYRLALRVAADRLKG